MQTKILTRQYITVRFSMPGLHQWHGAPEEVSWLRFPHRHLFGFKADFEVGHKDRQLEFFIMTGKLQDYLRQRWGYSELRFGSMSCEMIADEILREFAGLGCFQVEVSEDGENSGVSEIVATPQGARWEDVK